MIAYVQQLNHDLPTATRCFGKPGLTPRARLLEIARICLMRQMNGCR